MSSSAITSVEQIALRLRVTREALGLSQVELCRRSGLATNTYNQWEKGKGRPDLDGAIAYSKAFRIPLDWIYLGDPSGLPHSVAGNIVARMSSFSADRSAKGA